jgi:hypothetical protein
MSEELADPVSAAEAKAIQLLQVAVMAAEGVAVLAAARAEARAARTEADAERLLEEIEAARVPAEHLWRPALDPARRGELNDRQALTAWAAAQPWRDVDPTAAEASRASLDRLRELDPVAVRSYDTLQSKGIAPAQAMKSAVSVLAGTAPSSTAPAPRGGVIHSASDAVAASYPRPLTGTAARVAPQPGAAGAAARQQLSNVAKPRSTRLGR